MNYIVTKQMKSKGTAAILVIFFGGIGLFYSSVVGGLFMTLGFPLLVFLFMGLGIAIKSTAIIFLVIITCLLYWIICLIWAMKAVDNYNNKILEEAAFYNNGYSNVSTVNQQYTSNIIPMQHETISNKDELQQDLGKIKSLYDTKVIGEEQYLKQKENIERRLEILEHNETLQNTPQVYEQVYQQIPNNEKSNKAIWIGIVALLLLLGLAYFLYDDKTNSLKFNKITNIFSSHSKDKEEIKTQLERAYFNSVSGGYTAQNIGGLGSEGMPFYNTNEKSLTMMGMLPFAQIIGQIQIQPTNVDAYEFIDSNNTAKLKYDVSVIFKNDTTKGHIDMIAKKIGGVWKFDAEKFFGFDKKKSTTTQKGAQKIEPNKIAIDKPKITVGNESELYTDKILISRDEMKKAQVGYKIIKEQYKDKSSKDFTDRYLIFVGRNVYIISNGKPLKEWKIIKTSMEDEDIVYHLNNGDKIYQLDTNIDLFEKAKNAQIHFVADDIPNSEIIIDEEYLK